MYFALIRKKIEIFDYLTTEMDIDYEYPDGRTVLYRIVTNISVKKDGVLRALHLTKNINYANTIDGNTILHKIVHSIQMPPYGLEVEMERYKEKLSILIENGADPYIKNKQNISSIDLSLSHIDSMKSLEILLNNKINKPIEIEIFNSALCKNYVDKYDMVELLMHHVTDINELCKNNHSVLWNAKNTYTLENDLIELLEESGAISI